MSSLENLGWTPFFQNQIDPENDTGLKPVRIVEEQRGNYRVRDAGGIITAETAGRLRHETLRAADRPCVGDWVLIRTAGGDGPGLITRVLARKTCFSRHAPGEVTEEQVIAANVDTVFLVQSLNHDFNPRRLERYLALLWESGAEPVILLNKADLQPDTDPFVAEIGKIAPGVPCCVLSALEDRGLEALTPWLRPGRTVALVGSSGVGKSTILNRLAGEELIRVSDIREDGRGRHTTTARHLIPLDSGAMLLDTPGMRTVLLWEGAEGVGHVFEDIEALARECRFSDCGHRDEPGCAILAGLETGVLDPGRWKSYEKLEREARFIAAKTDVRLRIENHKKWKKIHLDNRRRPDKRRMGR